MHDRRVEGEVGFSLQATARLVAAPVVMVRITDAAWPPEVGRE
jgi:hypothetical protein